MAWIHLKRIEGMVFQPDLDSVMVKKHPCPDCFACQVCSDSRCSRCRNPEPESRSQILKTTKAVKK